MTERRPFCADLSRENGEPLGATASRIDHWFLIEYRGSGLTTPWPAAGCRTRSRPGSESRSARFRTGACSSSAAPTAGERETLVAFTADSRAGNERLRRFDLESHESLREVDLLDEDGGARVEHPLFLICTHGKHDPCCARYGRPLYEGLRGRGRGGLGLADDPHRRRPLRRQPRVPARGGLLRSRGPGRRGRHPRRASRGARVPRPLSRPLDLSVRRPGGRASSPGGDGPDRHPRRRPAPGGTGRRELAGHVPRRRGRARGRCPRRARRPDVSDLYRARPSSGRFAT